MALSPSQIQFIASLLTDDPDIIREEDAVARTNQLAMQGRQVNQQAAQNDANFEARRYLFTILKRFIPAITQTDWRTPEAASALYNQLGRSQGIMQLIQQNPDLMNRILVQWMKMAMAGETTML